MMVNKVTSLADIVYEQVERDILGGVYRRGDTLTELRLSEQLEKMLSEQLAGKNRTMH